MFKLLSLIRSQKFAFPYSREVCQAIHWFRCIFQTNILISRDNGLFLLMNTFYHNVYETTIKSHARSKGGKRHLKYKNKNKIMF